MPSALCFCLCQQDRGSGCPHHPVLMNYHLCSCILPDSEENHSRTGTAWELTYPWMMIIAAERWPLILISVKSRRVVIEKSQDRERAGRFQPSCLWICLNWHLPESPERCKVWKYSTVFFQYWGLNFPSAVFRLQCILHCLPRHSCRRLFDFASKLVKKQQFKSKFF